MIMKNNKVLNIYFTDTKIGFSLFSHASKSMDKTGYVILEEGILDNGSILEPEVLYEKLKYALNENKIKTKHLNIILHDQNILMRELIIQKSDLQKKSILQYIKEQMGKSIHLLFDHPTVTHYVRSETEESMKVLLVIANEDMLHDYMDVFERLGFTDIHFDLPAMAQYNAYLLQGGIQKDHLMLISYHDHAVTLKIFHEGFPVFSMIDDYDTITPQFFDIMENLVERVINFYTYNICKGHNSVEHLVFFNFSDELTDNQVYEQMNKRFTQYPREMVKEAEEDQYTSKCIRMSNYTAMPKVESLSQYEHIPFPIQRTPKINSLLGYMNVLSFVLLTTILLIYLPYISIREDIINQMNINHRINVQIESIREDMVEQVNYTKDVVDHSKAYDYLTEESRNLLEMMHAMQSVLRESVLMTSYTVDQTSQTIKIMLLSSSLYDLNDSVMMIYETYGVMDGVDVNRFISETPEIKMITDTLMEVTIHYA